MKERIARGVVSVLFLVAASGAMAPPAAASGAKAPGGRLAARDTDVGAADTNAPPRADPALAAAADDTRTYLSRLEKLGFAGVVLVAKDGDPVVASGCGLADRERGLRWSPATVSTIGSITKQFTGAAILKLEEDGKLSVSDPIGRYFEDVPADKAAITLYHLLTHSSGLSDPEEIGDFTEVTLDGYVRRVLARPLLFAPGAGYEYANANFSLLGAIIQKLSGESYEAFLRERLFLPLGMYETGYLLPRWGDGRLAQGYLEGRRWGTIIERPMAPDGPYWALRANGGINSTVYDMLRWAEALLGGRALGPESMKKYWSPHVKERGADSYYGYGWVIARGPVGEKIVTHNGGNGIFFADMAIVPDARLVVFLMTNVVSESRVANMLLEQIEARFLAGMALPVIPEVVEIPGGEAALKPYVGTYPWAGRAAAAAGNDCRVTMDGGALFIEAEGQAAFDALHSVRDAKPGRLERLSRLTDEIVTAYRKGDFGPLAKAYGDVTVERLKASWAEASKEMEERYGRILRHEILGSAATEDRDETVVRFHCERGTADRTYVWDAELEGRLLGVSARGLAVRLRLYPSGEREFFTWDGGIRPPKLVRFEPGPDGRLQLRLGPGLSK